MPGELRSSVDQGKTDAILFPPNLISQASSFKQYRRRKRTDPRVAVLNPCRPSRPTIPPTPARPLRHQTRRPHSIETAAARTRTPCSSQPTEKRKIVRDLSHLAVEASCPSSRLRFAVPNQCLRRQRYRYSRHTGGCKPFFPALGFDASAVRRINVPRIQQPCESLFPPCHLPC
ncbi:hypothetical protein N658DRAFT_178658 [Parathielavia hyrcaniae]|uniref:Uncharacterized protein n=1 Tax=Parathielavia hyrcaniae TaxID=113614 RepID=A0AAN6Q6G1_9PEZI|nr:hypothetical protein N658DRAFT_178658 [Parathielavia hyrcaniae]